MKQAVILLIILCAAASILPAQSNRLKLATTTSTENSGLLAELVPPFERKTGIRVDVIAVGTGKALRLGENGDVDLVLVHARQAEGLFVDQGCGVNRRDVMHNDFVILGPADDPAGIRGLSSAAAALKKIAASGAGFISRGDDSGTHKKEKDLWEGAGLKPKGRWYKEAGQGMGAVITMANDMRAYTMADRGTYLALKGKVRLEVMVEGDPSLFNPYGIIAVNPARHPHVNYSGAMLFIDWITSKEGRGIIGNFRKNGEPLFYPDTGR